MPAFNRRQGLLGGLASVVMSKAAWAAAEGLKLTFVLVNDFYKMSEEDGRGGIARLAAVVRAERAKGTADGRKVFFVHAGDTLSPSLMSGFDQGQHMIALFNALEPDVFVPGNHEYDFGPEVYLTRMGEAKFPILAANLRTAEGGLLPRHADNQRLDESERPDRRDFLPVSVPLRLDAPRIPLVWNQLGQ